MLPQPSSKTFHKPIYYGKESNISNITKPKHTISIASRDQTRLRSYSRPFIGVLPAELYYQNYPEIIKAANEALQFYPNSAEAYHYLSVCYAEQKKFTQSVEHAQAAMLLGKTPTDLARAYSSIAFVSLRMGNLERARKYIDYALKLEPQNFFYDEVKSQQDKPEFFRH